MRTAYIYLIPLLLSSAIFLIANYCGLGYTYDSSLYFEIAEQIKQQGAMSAQGFSTKPPAYPILISIVGSENIVVVNYFFLQISISILITLGLELKVVLLKYLYIGLIVFSTPLYLVHSFAWTEPLFIIVLLFAFFLLHAYQKERKRCLLLSSLILLMSLPFIRFAGVLIMMPTFLIVFTFFPIKGKKYLLFSILALSGIILLIWILRFEEGFIRRWNVLLSPFFSNNYSRYIHNLESYLQALSIWVVPFSLVKPLRLSCGILILIVLFIISTKGLLEKKLIIKNGLPIIFIIYYIFLHSVFPVEYYSAERYLTPLVNLLLFSLFLWLEAYFPSMKRMAKACVILFLSALLLYNMARTAKNIFFWHEVRCYKDFSIG